MTFFRRHLHYFIVAGILTSVFALVTAYFFGRRSAFLERLPYIAGADELRPLEAKYGDRRDSLLAEEWMIRDFFKDKRGGVFVDVGANDYRFASNTYYLETELGWSGLAIEPQTKFAADYERHRPGTTFVPLFVSDTTDEGAQLYVPADDLLASASAEYARSQGTEAKDVEVIQTKTTTLDDILDRSGITAIDLLSIDIELHEPQALAGFSIERFRPALVCIEAHREVRQTILDYFARHGYVIVGDYLRADGHNLWFTPLQRGT